MHQPPPISELLDALARFATMLADLLARPNLDWKKRPAAGEWSLTEVVCHLRDVEREVHQARFQALLAKEDAFLPGAVTDEWVTTRQYQEQNGRFALQEFLDARQQTIQLLQSIADPDSWNRRGRHAFFGPTSLHELVNLAVKHDEAHLPQIAHLAGIESFPEA
ncbi:MAG: DinB family protein [Chloroflexi bacterium]|nr:MAG: DinB family protein [Chloroflexota bacterium]